MSVPLSQNYIVSPPLISAPPNMKPTKVGKSGHFSRSVPLQLFEEKFEKENGYHKDFIALVNRLHDILLWRHSFGDGGNIKNPMSNYDYLEGKVPLEDLLPMFRFGIPDGFKPETFPFYEPNVEILRGMYLGQRQSFELRSINPDAPIRRKEQMAEVASEHFLRTIVEEASRGTGIDLTQAMTNPDLDIPKEVSAVNAIAKERGILEKLMVDLLDESMTKHDLSREIADTLIDKIACESQLIEVIPMGSTVKAERVPRGEISWLGKEHFKDTSELDAIMRTRYLSYQNIVLNYPHFFLGADSRTKFNNIITDLQAPSSEAGRTWFNSISSQVVDGKFDFMSFDTRALGRMFYRYSQDTILLAEQKMYFKMLRYQNYKLTLGGKKLDAIQMERYKKGQFDYVDELMYEEVTEEFAKKNSSRLSIAALPKVEMWKSVRVGHKFITHLGRLQGYVDERDETTLKYPVVGYVGERHSIVSKTKYIQVMYVYMMTLLKKQMSFANVKALFYDIAQLPEGLGIDDVMFEMNEAGLVQGDSSKLDNEKNSRDKQLHMTTVDMTMSDAMVRIINLLTVLRQMLDEICGITPSMKGILQDRQGQKVTEAAIAQGNMALISFYRDNSKFFRDVLQAMASIGRHVWAKNEKRFIITPDARDGKLLELTEDLSLETFGIFADDGMDIQAKQAKIEDAFRQGMTTDAKMIRDYIKFINTRNPERWLEVFDQGLSAAEAMQQNMLAANQKNAELRAQVELEKAKVPERVAVIAAEAKIKDTQMKLDAQAGRTERQIEFKEDLTDVKNEHDFVKMNLQQQAQEAQAQGEPNNSGV